MERLTTRLFVAVTAVSLVALALGTWWVRRAVEAQLGPQIIVEQTVERVDGREVVRESRRELPSGSVAAARMKSDERVSPLAREQVAALNRRLLLALSVIVLGAGLVTVLVARRVLGPVHALRHAAEAMAAGKLDTRVAITGRDELAALGQAFNSMAGALSQQDRLKRDLTNDIAHELRTPLTDLRCHIEALQDAVVAVTPDTLSTLHAEVAHLQRLVEDLGDLARAEARQLQLTPEQVDAAALVQQLIRHATPRAASLGVTVEAIVPEHHVAVWADPGRLRQVLSNLLDNALVHTPPGGRVSISVHGGPPVVTIDVADTGPGIPAEHLPHVFDRFYRADPSRSRTTGGVGLGLAIARQMVEASGGTITAGSTPGAGTVFTIRWPSAFTASS